MKKQESNDASAAEAERTRLRPGLALFPLDNELVVFSEEAQCLVGLNESAAFVYHELQQGTPTSELPKALTSAGLAAPEEAERWVKTTLEALDSHGMLANGQAPIAITTGSLDEDRIRAARVASMPAYAPLNPAAEQHYRLLNTCVLIRFDHLAQVRLVNAAIGHLATDDSLAPTVTLELRATMLDNQHLRSDIYRDGKPLVYAPRLSMLAPVVKGALWQSAVNAYDFLFYIHAGVVGTDEGCVLLPAAAGSGKSSLTAALAHAGFRYYSDEVALVERTTFKVPPVPLAICVKSTGWDLMARYYPDIMALPMHHRDDGKDVRYVAPPAGAAQQPPGAVSHIVFPRHDKDATTELKPVSRSEALGRLMGECLALRLRLDRNNVGQIVRWIAGIDCYALTFSSLDEATDLVAQLVK